MTETVNSGNVYEEKQDVDNLLYSKVMCKQRNAHPIHAHNTLTHTFVLNMYIHAYFFFSMYEDLSPFADIEP